MSDTPLLRLENIAKAYAAPVLKDVNLSLRAGEVHALLGENGAGKSTLGKIMCGVVRPDAGQLFLQGQPFAPTSKATAEALGLRMVKQELSIIGTLSVAENVFLPSLRAHKRWGLLSPKALAKSARPFLASVGLQDVDPEQPAGSLGVGQQQAIEIASALTTPCRLLVLDEPTASLSAHETEKLFERIGALRREGTTVVYVSHRLEEIKRISDRLSVLRDGQLVHTGPAAELDTREAIRLMIGRPLGTLSARVNPDVPREAGLQVQALTTAAVTDVAFTAYKGEIFGFAGQIGAGRTETLRAIFGADPRRTGKIVAGAQKLSASNTTQTTNAGLVYLTEDRKGQGLLLSAGVADNMTLGLLPKPFRPFPWSLLSWMSWAKTDLSACAAMVQRLTLRCSDLAQPVKQLSGGNQQKVLIARALLAKPEVLMFDEPTRGIDVGARLEIYEQLRALAKQQKTVIVASSDIHELMAICDRIAVMSRGRLVRVLERADFDETTILAAALAAPGPAAKEQHT
ncbi:MAG: sugar ABC transporter ATP-binding protein [Deltaproteobacteria bacterium]|nr:sugar ABC transporter ATP-binding protein [Deltaproteobacteria bacterium]